MYFFGSYHSYHALDTAEGIIQVTDEGCYRVGATSGLNRCTCQRVLNAVLPIPPSHTSLLG